AARTSRHSGGRARALPASRLASLASLSASQEDQARPPARRRLTRPNLARRLPPPHAIACGFFLDKKPLARILNLMVKHSPALDATFAALCGSLKAPGNSMNRRTRTAPEQGETPCRLSSTTCTLTPRPRAFSTPS